jgi:hypothetical protein
VIEPKKYIRTREGATETALFGAIFLAGTAWLIHKALFRADTLPDAYAWAVWVCGLAVGGFFSAAFAYLWLTSGARALWADEDGLWPARGTKEAGLVRWGDIRSVSERGMSSRYALLDAEGRRLIQLDRGLNDVEELLYMVANRSLQSTLRDNFPGDFPATRIIIRRVVVVLAVCVALTVAGLYFQDTTEISGPIFLFVPLTLITMAVSLWCVQWGVKLEPDRIVIQYLFRRKNIGLAAVESIAAKRAIKNALRTYPYPLLNFAESGDSIVIAPPGYSQLQVYCALNAWFAQCRTADVTGPARTGEEAPAKVGKRYNPPNREVALISRGGMATYLVLVALVLFTAFTEDRGSISSSWPEHLTILLMLTAFAGISALFLRHLSSLGVIADEKGIRLSRAPDGAYAVRWDEIHDCRYDPLREGYAILDAEGVVRVRLSSFLLKFDELHLAVVERLWDRIADRCYPVEIGSTRLGVAGAVLFVCFPYLFFMTFGWAYTLFLLPWPWVLAVWIVALCGILVYGWRRTPLAVCIHHDRIEVRYAGRTRTVMATEVESIDGYKPHRSDTGEFRPLPVINLYGGKERIDLSWLEGSSFQLYCTLEAWWRANRAVGLEEGGLATEGAAIAEGTGEAEE